MFFRRLQGGKIIFIGTHVRAYTYTTTAFSRGPRFRHSGHRGLKVRVINKIIWPFLAEWPTLITQLCVQGYALKGVKCTHFTIGVQLQRAAVQRACDFTVLRISISERFSRQKGQSQKERKRSASDHLYHSPSSPRVPRVFSTYCFENSYSDLLDTGGYFFL